jgi:hypothetical protein
MPTTLLISLGIALGGVGLLVVGSMLWSWRQERKEAKLRRERGPGATLAPLSRPEHDTDRWNLSR